MRYTRVSGNTNTKTSQRKPIRYSGLNKKTRAYGPINDRHCTRKLVSYIIITLSTFYMNLTRPVADRFIPMRIVKLQTTAALFSLANVRLDEKLIEPLTKCLSNGPTYKQDRISMQMHYTIFHVSILD